MLTELQREHLATELVGLKRFCLSLARDKHDAEDLLQLTVERLLSKGMPTDAHVAKWSYRVCRNIWVDELRSREVRARFSKAELTANGEAIGHSAESEHALELERVNEALLTLPEEQRSVLLLVAVEGRSYAEVAAILSVPIGTIMSRVARARRALAEKMHRH